jgi:hypothetical protein
LRVKSRMPPERSHVSFRQLLRTYQRTRVQQLCAISRREQVQQILAKDSRSLLRSKKKAAN